MYDARSERIYNKDPRKSKYLTCRPVDEFKTAGGEDLRLLDVELEVLKLVELIAIRIPDSMIRAILPNNEGRGVQP